MSKSSNLNTQELEARVQRNGWQRDRHSLEARRLLNGNYLTVGRTGERIFLAETTDGLFHRKNGLNVVKIHEEWSIYSSLKTIEYFEYQIDTMLQLDKNRLSNGNYLTIERSADDRFAVIETTDGAFAGQDSENFVNFHTNYPPYSLCVRVLADLVVAQRVHAAIIAEDAQQALAVVKRNEKRRAARAKKKASAA